MLRIAECTTSTKFEVPIKETFKTSSKLPLARLQPSGPSKTASALPHLAAARLMPTHCNDTTFSDIYFETSLGPFPSASWSRLTDLLDVF